MVFVYTAMGVLCVEHANVLELCYIELLSGDGSPYSILSDHTEPSYFYNLQVRIQGGPGGRAPPLTLGFEAPKLNIFGPYLIFP